MTTIWNMVTAIPDSAIDISLKGGRVVGSDRVLNVLIELANRPNGVTLDDIAKTVRSPKTTVHRALASLCRAGLANRDGRGHYILGDEFLRLAFSHHESRPDHLRVQPILRQLAEHLSRESRSVWRLNSSHFNHRRSQPGPLHRDWQGPALATVVDLRRRQKVGWKSSAHSTHRAHHNDRRRIASPARTRARARLRSG